MSYLWIFLLCDTFLVSLRNLLSPLLTNLGDFQWRPDFIKSELIDQASDAGIRPIFRYIRSGSRASSSLSI